MISKRSSVRLYPDKDRVCSYRIQVGVRAGGGPSWKLDSCGVHKECETKSWKPEKGKQQRRQLGTQGGRTSNMKELPQGSTGTGRITTV